MAQRLWNQFQYSLEKGVSTIYMNVAIGSSGAPTLTAKENKGIQAIVRNSAGDYTVTLGQPSATGQVAVLDKYQRILNINYVSIAGASVSAVTGCYLVADSVKSAGTFEIVFTAPTSSSVTTPVATDPASGEIILLEIVLKNYGI